MWTNDLIAAISTPPGEGGIAIVRLSGASSWSIAAQVFKRNKEFEPKPWRVYLGYVVDPGGNVIDECLATFFRGPKSFTGEDLVELSVHGGSFVAGRVLECLISKGARLAGPGEFTKRAFLNGRLDLSQAEAVIDVIRASNDVALRNAGQQLRGLLSREISEARQLLLSAMAKIEASIDFPEHDIPAVTYKDIQQALDEARLKISELVNTTRAGRVAKDGLRVALVGRPNVGKSSLLNRLAGQERAIVTHIAGTTRDTVEVDINIGGVLISLIDTAGLRESTDVVESMGIARTEAAMEQAEVLLVLVEGSSSLTAEDLHILSNTANRKRLVVVTKADQPQQANLSGLESFSVSSLTGKGIPELRQYLSGVARTAIGPGDSVLVTNLRHAAVLQDTLKALQSAISSVIEQWDLDVVAVEIREAYERLGEISGDTVTADVADVIFSQFCIGK